jgi:aspartyl-tRNA(Asn)/glutamyl-tRNA(Gln) amidotransferase subunit A
LLASDFTKVFRSGIDLLLTPTTPTAAFRLGEKLTRPLDMYLSDIFTVTANLAGVPALAVPCGQSGAGLPIGAQLIAPHFRESDLFRAAAAIERTFPAGAPPDPAARAR